jgi:hypothetical protein
LLTRDALTGRVDRVLAEALDRFSRDQEDTAGRCKRLTLAGVSIVTLTAGEITHLSSKDEGPQPSAQRLADPLQRVSQRAQAPGIVPGRGSGIVLQRP